MEMFVSKRHSPVEQQGWSSLTGLWRMSSATSGSLFTVPTSAGGAAVVPVPSNDCITGSRAFFGGFREWLGYNLLPSLDLVGQLLCWGLEM